MRVWKFFLEEDELYMVPDTNRGYEGPIYALAMAETEGEARALLTADADIIITLPDGSTRRNWDPEWLQGANVESFDCSTSAILSLFLVPV